MKNDRKIGHKNIVMLEKLTGDRGQGDGRANLCQSLRYSLFKWCRLIRPLIRTHDNKLDIFLANFSR